MKVIEYIQRRIARTADWRRSLAVEFPQDSRNLEAAQRLDELAMADARIVSPHVIESLAPYVGSPMLREVISAAARDVAFRREPDDLEEFLSMVASNIARH
jgi:hypothetical protein